jgi:hypothetical protein
METVNCGGYGTSQQVEVYHPFPEFVKVIPRSKEGREVLKREKYDNKDCRSHPF